MCKYSHRIWRSAADLSFSDFMFGQFHHGKVSLPQGADDLIKPDLQGSSLGSAGLSPPAVLGHDHHVAATVRRESIRLLPAETKATLYFSALHYTAYSKILLFYKIILRFFVVQINEVQQINLSALVGSQ